MELALLLLGNGLGLLAGLLLALEALLKSLDVGHGIYWSSLARGPLD